MQRLFSTFPQGLPGAGLLLLRAALAVPLFQQALNGSRQSPLELLAAGAALLLMIGLWTPVAGVLVAILQLGLAWSHPADAWTSVQFAILGAALAMLGPGSWSVDARLFGRKQIPIPQR